MNTDFNHQELMELLAAVNGRIRQQSRDNPFGPGLEHLFSAREKLLDRLLPVASIPDCRETSPGLEK